MERTYTVKEKVANWLYYHIWWLVLAGLLAVIFGSMISNRFQLNRQACDYCISYVGTAELPADCVSALTAELADYGSDVNGDGQVSVKINQYIVSETAAVSEYATYGRAAEVALLTDISEGESYFFLVEYPEEFQKDFQLMAHMDGSPSAEEDFNVWDKVYRWADCPTLASLNLGESTDESGAQVDHQTLLANLYIGRRCFVTPHVKANLEENAALWSLLTAGAVPPDQAG